MSMITKDILLDNNYKRFNTNSINHPLAECGFQRKIFDNSGIKYFINAYEYNFEHIPNYPNPNRISYQFEVQFNLQDDESVNITYGYDRKKSLQEIEDWFEMCWINLNCIYYEKYEY